MSWNNLIPAWMLTPDYQDYNYNKEKEMNDQTTPQQDLPASAPVAPVNGAGQVEANTEVLHTQGELEVGSPDEATQSADVNNTVH